MKFLKPLALHIFVILSLTMCASASTSVMGSMYPAHGPKKGAYWPSWSIDFPPSAIDTRLFTHIYYAFLNPNNVTFKFEIDDSTVILLKNFTTTLHRKNPPVKTLFSIGGGSEGPSLVLAHMASRQDFRESFILSSIEVARKFDFDGFDLDWEFPRNPNDMMNFHLLLQQWHAAVKNDAKATGRPQLLISAATYYSPELTLLDNVYRKYPVDSINKYLDWINVMFYDYHGSWDVSATGTLAALYDPNSNVSTSYGLQSWIKSNIQREKLIMGLPLYGRTWKLKDPSLHGIGAPAVDVGPGDDGTMIYADVEKFNIQNKATVVFDLPTVSTYSYAGTTWIGYDDVRSVALKVAYAQTLKLGGYFFWSVDGDLDWKISRRASEAWIH